MRLLSDATIVSLPGGIPQGDGSCARSVRLRPVSGEDEEWLLSLEAPVPQARLVTELLARCVERIGLEPVSRELVRGLVVGDREFLLLQLHAISFGSRVELVRRCPHEGCGAKMDVDFDLASVPIEEQPVQRRYDFKFDSGEAPPRHIGFRLPQGADQEAACDWPGLSAQDKAVRLLAHCLLELDGKAPVEPADAQALPADARAALEREMERCSPKVHFDLEAACPHCGRTFGTRIDPASFVLEALLRARADFERDLHSLAFHYHWPLNEILRLPRLRRQRYVSLLARQLDRTVDSSYIAA